MEDAQLQYLRIVGKISLCETLDVLCA
jgi:hypothetical protein